MTRPIDVIATAAVVVATSVLAAFFVQRCGTPQDRSYPLDVLRPWAGILLASLFVIPGVYAIALFCGIQPVFEGWRDPALLLLLDATIAFAIVLWLTSSRRRARWLLRDDVDIPTAVRRVLAFVLCLLVFGILCSIVSFLD